MTAAHIPRTATREMGKLETMERLGFGQVPAAPLFRLWESMGIQVEMLCPPRRLYHYKITGYMRFDTADKMMADSGLGGFGWMKLPEIYRRVNLSIPKNVRSTPRLHATTAMFLAGCKCLACAEMWSQTRSARKEKVAA